MEGLHWRKVGAVAIGDLGGDSEGARDGNEAGKEEGKAHNEGEGETKVGGGSNVVGVLPRRLRWQGTWVTEVGTKRRATAAQAGGGSSQAKEARNNGTKERLGESRKFGERTSSALQQVPAS